MRRSDLSVNFGCLVERRVAMLETQPLVSFGSGSFLLGLAGVRGTYALYGKKILFLGFSP